MFILDAFRRRSPFPGGRCRRPNRRHRRPAPGRSSRRRRCYRDHSRAALLLAPRLLGAEALGWLQSDPAVFAAPGWRVGADLWLVCKRAADALRTHLLATGHSGVPADNDRVFDVLQDHGILIRNRDRAVWIATVAGDGYAHPMILLRLPVARLWSDPEAAPPPFAGTVEPAAEPPPPSPPDSLDRPDPPDAAAPPAPSETATAMDADPGAVAPVNAAGPAASAPAPSRGRQFLGWLADGLRSGRLEYNRPTARVHVVAEGVLLASPAIFKDYAAGRGCTWNAVQNSFLKLGLRRPTAGGINVHDYAVVGSGTKISGLLLTDPGVLFGAVVPTPNPRLTSR